MKMADRRRIRKLHFTLHSDDANLDHALRSSYYFPYFGSFLFTVFNCPFDSDLCGFVQSSNDTFNWTINSGRTPSHGTGPTQDVSGNGKIFLGNVYNFSTDDISLFPRYSAW